MTGTSGSTNGSGLHGGHYPGTDPFGFNEDPFDPKPDGGNGPTPAPPVSYDLGEWDFGAANIIASELPPRGWLLGIWLCRQFVSALIADGAAGKTATRIACALSLATWTRAAQGAHL